MPATSSSSTAGACRLLLDSYWHERGRGGVPLCEQRTTFHRRIILLSYFLYWPTSMAPTPLV